MRSMTLTAIAALSLVSANSAAAQVEIVGPGKLTTVSEVNGLRTYRAEPDQGAVFIRWGGLCTGTDPVCSVYSVALALGGDLIAQFGWVVTVEIRGIGRVTDASGTGIDCVAAARPTKEAPARTARVALAVTECSGIVSPPTLDLRASTTLGQTFVEWGGACAPAGSSPTCSVSASPNMNVKASFQSAPTRRSLRP